MSSESKHPKAAPGAWLNRGEVYIFFLSTPGEIPEGAYAPLEARSYFASPEAGTFRGGLGAATVQVVRYTDSPAGPYDELLYIPGRFDNPSGKAHLRITRIYVSTDASTYNGRKNWNIPKHVARFAFTRIQPDSALSPVKIEVFPLSPANSSPFFSAVATPSSWAPNFPFNSRRLALDTLMVHPPVPSQGPDAYSMIGTDRWVSIRPCLRGKAEIVWYTPGGGGSEGVQPGEYADGVEFPKFKAWRFGVHVKDLVLDFPEGDVVEDKKTK
ncbi:hypothetical protein JB92DRAFT_3143667 [Gautieria morchelliformis]|nr:hypothetical protein JB92DRAFT_3143667 [Gautieria morchelliformis]